MDGGVLGRLTLRARGEWPELNALPVSELEAFILRRIPADRLDEDVRAEDLLLACACAAGIRAAHDALEEMTDEDVERVYARIRPPATSQRAKQLVFAKLFAVPEGGVPRIALYRGDIEIIGFVRNVASRELLGLAHRTKQRPDSLEDNILQAEPAAGSPRRPFDAELDRVKRNYLPGLRVAITHAFASLEVRERALLRYAVVEQLGTDALGLLYGLAPDAAAEWLRVTREKLEFRLKHRLAERLRVSDRDHATLLRFVHAQLDLLLTPTLVPGT